MQCANLLLLEFIKFKLLHSNEIRFLHFSHFRNRILLRHSPICFTLQLSLDYDYCWRGTSTEKRDDCWCTLFKIFIFCPKNQLQFPEKILDFWVKNLWKCCGFGLFSCWQLWFHEINCQKKKFGWKTRENAGVLSK